MILRNKLPDTFDSEIRDRGTILVPGDILTKGSILAVFNFH